MFQDDCGVGGKDEGAWKDEVGTFDSGSANGVEPCGLWMGLNFAKR